MTQNHNHPVALVTGSAQRIGAETVKRLHSESYSIVLHYRNSSTAAEQLKDELNAIRPNSTAVVKADLNTASDIQQLAESAQSAFGRIDLLVNNASSFYPTPVGTVNEDNWHDLMSSNLKAPFFLSQALAPELAKNQGAIINLIDIHADRPLKAHPVYCMAKAGLAMMTKSLAKELGPDVRVNGVAPGAILWPEQSGEMSEAEKANILERVPLGRAGEPADIANTIVFLATNAPYISGQIIAVDGGRSMHG